MFSYSPSVNELCLFHTLCYRELRISLLEKVKKEHQLTAKGQDLKAVADCEISKSFTPGTGCGMNFALSWSLLIA